VLTKPVILKTETQFTPMTIHTRPACDSDYDWLYALNQEVYQDLIMLEFGYWDVEEELALFQKAWQSQSISLIMVAEERAGMFILEEHDNHLWLAEIQITALYQNRGIGTKVIQQLLAMARQQKTPLRLRVLHANHRAYQLYQRLGFHHIDSAKHHHVMQAD
jgi:ribosomal protein S18 acetylase RimI-like enzyme